MLFNIIDGFNINNNKDKVKVDIIKLWVLLIYPDESSLECDNGPCVLKKDELCPDPNDKLSEDWLGWVSKCNTLIIWR